MRLFLGGVVVGCLSSASLFLARSHFEQPLIDAPQHPLIKDPHQHSVQAPHQVTTPSLHPHETPTQPPQQHPTTPSVHPHVDFPHQTPTSSPQHHPTTPSLHFHSDSPLHPKSTLLHPQVSSPHPSTDSPLIPQHLSETQASTQSPQPFTDTTATTTISRAEQILAHGRPSGGRLQKHYFNHVLEYDCSRRIPVWVAEHLTRDSLKGEASRSRSRFMSDPDIPEECSAQNSDYRRSGWSRGHMAPSGDNKGSQEAMDNTFLLTNILPQDIDNNAGFWNRLEIFCRDLTETYSDVWVTSGPVFLPTVSEDGRKRVTYEVIGDNEVAVPTHLYKVIVAKQGGQVATGAFIVPNKPLTYAHHLTSFQVPLSHLERKVGTRFYTDLDRSSAKDLCQETGCNLLTKEGMDAIIYSSRLKRAGSIHKLDKVWRELQEKNITTTGKLQDLYEGRRKDLLVVAAEKGEEQMPSR